MIAKIDELEKNRLRSQEIIKKQEDLLYQNTPESDQYRLILPQNDVEIQEYSFVETDLDDPDDLSGVQLIRGVEWTVAELIDVFGNRLFKILAKEQVSIDITRRLNPDYNPTDPNSPQYIILERLIGAQTGSIVATHPDFFSWEQTTQHTVTTYLSPIQGTAFFEVKGRARTKGFGPYSLIYVDGQIENNVTYQR